VKYLISFFTLFLLSTTLFSQGFRLPTPVWDAGTLDNEMPEMQVYDREGNRYNFSELQFKLSNKKTRAINQTYTAGIFRLHFDDASTNVGFDDAVNGLQRAQVAVQVFTDLSNLINEANSPFTSIPNLGNGSSFVEVHVQPSLNNISNPTLGTAGQFFLTSSNGIVHGSVWQTINSGIDAWNVVNPSNLGTTGIFHANMQINFGHNFYTGTNASGIGATQVDLYSVILHEAMHSLGIGSLIAQNGTSKLTNSNPGIYSNYDLLLTNTSGTNLITWNNCYTASFVTSNASLLTLPCAIKFNGTNSLFVSSDANWSNGTSLSHFPAACGNTGNLVMNPGMSAGTTKRFPDEKEITALCALGYSTNGIYPGATYTNAATCGSIIAGVNDYATYASAAPNVTYITNSNTPISINSTDFLSNDKNATYYSCLEVVNQSGTITGNVNGGVNSTITFTPNSTFAGTAILKYIPKTNATGAKGNITYIFISVSAPAMPSCIPTNPCEMVCFGGFEEYTSQAQFDIYTFGGFTNSNYPSFSYYPATYPDNSPDFRNAGQYTWSGNGNCGGPQNYITAHTGTSFVGMILRNSPNGDNNPEGPALPLNSQLYPGESATVTFWLRLGDQLCNGGVEVRMINMPPCMGNNGFLLSSCSGLIQTPTIASGACLNNNNWQQKTVTITNTMTVPMTHLLINSLPYTNYSTTFGFIFLDVVSCIKNSPLLTISKIGPPKACFGDTVQYTIQVNNNTTSPVNNITINDVMGNGLQYVSGGTFTYPTQTIPNLAASAMANYTVRAVVNATFGNVTNTIQVTSGACLTNTSNSSSTLSVNNTDLQITSTCNKTKPCRGDTVTMTLNVCNYTQNPQNNIGLQTIIPNGYIPLAGAGYTIVGNVINWNPITIGAGTITNPTCVILTYKVKLGAISNNICTSILNGTDHCISAANCFAFDFTNCAPENINNVNLLTALDVYPNPASNEIHFDINTTNAKGKIEIYNTIGQLITYKLITGNKENILFNTSTWANGLYQYSIILNNQKVKTGSIGIVK
jgi:uncharacterized repeat protein (TIGR01451 family)